MSSPCICALGFVFISHLGAVHALIGQILDSYLVSTSIGLNPRGEEEVGEVEEEAEE